MVTANDVMNIVNSDETFKTMEMSLNKEGVMLDKSKMLIMKIGGFMIAVPL